MSVRDVLAERVRRQRMALGLNQGELAERTEIPYQVLSRLEHGKQSLYVERLAELADALQVSTDYLLGRTDDPTPPKRRRQRRHAAAEPEAEPCSACGDRGGGHVVGCEEALLSPAEQRAAVCALHTPAGGAP